jgi:serine/threonine protein kinase
LKRKFSSWEEVSRHREIRAIDDLSASPVRPGSEYVVKVFDIAREKSSELYFVMEYMENGTLHQYLSKIWTESGRNIQPRTIPVIPQPVIQSIISQCLHGLCHIHSRGYMHRDIKPENILMGCSGKVKLADFSLARKMLDATSTRKCVGRMSSPCLPTNSSQKSGTMTADVATRWYRAPEILRGDQIYTSAVDIFSLGCVVAEILALRPLLQGENDAHQKQLITDLLGDLLGDPFSIESLCLDEVQVEKGRASMRLFEGLAKAVPTANGIALNFMANMLTIDPNQRCTANEALASAFFGRSFNITKGHRQTSPPGSISPSTTPNSRPSSRAQFDLGSKGDRYQMSISQQLNDLAEAFIYPEFDRHTTAGTNAAKRKRSGCPPFVSVSKADRHRMSGAHELYGEAMTLPCPEIDRHETASITAYKRRPPHSPSFDSMSKADGCLMTGAHAMNPVDRVFLQPEFDPFETANIVAAERRPSGHPPFVSVSKADRCKMVGANKLDEIARAFLYPEFGYHETDSIYADKSRPSVVLFSSQSPDGPLSVDNCT